MKFFLVEPEVAGGLGKYTIMDRNTHPPIVSKLHYQFDGWLGDVLLESFPCFIVTEAAKLKLQAVGATGIRFDELKSRLPNSSKSFIRIDSFRSSSRCE